VQIGRTLVFESLEQAASYREYVCQMLRGNCADLVTLCGNKLSGRGVVLGSGFRVLPIEQAPCRFGTIPKGQQVRQHARHGLQNLGASTDYLHDIQLSDLAAWYVVWAVDDMGKQRCCSNSAAALHLDCRLARLPQ
jgi:hypothetical protein